MFGNANNHIHIINVLAKDITFKNIFYDLLKIMKRR